MKQPTKSLSLRRPIAAYFATDSGDGEAVSQCFTENAIVKDEGHTHKGRAAIKTWKTNASAKYQYTSEPFACEEKDGKIVVISHLKTGDQIVALRRNEIDLALISLGADLLARDFYTRKIDTVPSLVVLPLHHPLASEERIAFSQLKNDHFCAYRTLVHPDTIKKSPNSVGVSANSNLGSARCASTTTLLRRSQPLPTKK